MKKIRVTFLMCMTTVILLVIFCMAFAILVPAQCAPTPSSERRALEAIAAEYNELGNKYGYTAEDFHLASMRVDQNETVYYEVEFADSVRQPVHSVYEGTTAYYTGGTVIKKPDSDTLHCSLQHMIID